MASIKNQNQTRVAQHIPKSEIKNFQQSQKLTLLPKNKNFQKIKIKYHNTHIKISHRKIPKS